MFFYTDNIYDKSENDQSITNWDQLTIELQAAESPLLINFFIVGPIDSIFSFH